MSDSVRLDPNDVRVLGLLVAAGFTDLLVQDVSEAEYEENRQVIWVRDTGLDIVILPGGYVRGYQHWRDHRGRV